MIRGLQPGIGILEGWGLNTFTDDQLDEIHMATLDVLQNYGVGVYNDEALDIFEGGGAIVDRGSSHVKIPAYLVEDAIRSAPSTILLAGRVPEYDVTVQGGRIGFVNFGTGVRVIDPFTSEHRTTTLNDLAQTALVCDAMEHVDVFIIAVDASDVPESIAKGLIEAEAMFTNTAKHTIHGDFFSGVEGIQKFIQMAGALVGGVENLRERPIATVGGCPASPLELTGELCYIITEAARVGLPIMVLSMAMAGASAPVTLAGTLVTHNAEVLSGLVLQQLVSKGGPFIYGSSTTMMDMNYATAPVGAPELGMISAGATALARHYKLPCFMAGG